MTNQLSQIRWWRVTWTALTVYRARWLASFVKIDLELHGLVLGILVALVHMIFEGTDAFSLNSLLGTALIIGAGRLGGRWSARA